MSISKRKAEPVSVELMQKWLREGRGSGEREKYREWHTAERTPTPSHSGKLPCPLTGRELRSFLSEGEEGLFLGALRDCDISDARENFPLATTLTERICLAFRFPHPGGTNPANALLPFTTDLLVSRRSSPRFVALTTKPRETLRRPKDCLSLFVEHVHWSLLSVPFFAATELEMPKGSLKSLRWLRPERLAEDVSAADAALAGAFYREACDADWSNALILVVRAISSRLHIESERGLEVFKTLVWDGTIECDISRGITDQTRYAVTFD